MSASPLRQHGLYRFRGRLYVAVHLGNLDDAWGATALVAHPFPVHPIGMVYLRHADGVLLDYRDWQTVGSLADLADTGQDVAADDGPPP